MSELKSYINRVLGNSLRCLLPSYWWKRLFGLVVDRIDEVESTLSTSIDEAKRDVEIPILESEEELENLNVPIGKLATVIGKGRSFRECYWPTEFPENGDDIFPLLTHIPNINVSEGPITSFINILLQTSNNDGMAKVIQLVVDDREWAVAAVDGVTNRVYILSRYGQVNAAALQEFNDLLASDVYRYIARGGNDNLTEDEFDALDKLIRWDVSSDAYIKGGSWERLVKERDLEGIGGGTINANGVEIRELHISQLIENDTITQENQLTDEQKAYNLETLELARQNKAIASVPIYNARFLLYAYQGKTFIGSALENSSHELGFVVNASIDDQGNCLMELSIYGKDDQLSETSTNVVQNMAVTAMFKVVIADLKNKVDKVDGKQLSTEDFTSLLKAKLDGLNNYDDTSIKNAINSLTTQINTLVSGDASVAIESFNEIIAFLNGIEDSESLDSIIAAIEQQIAGKQNTIDDLADIRAGAALGATALQSVPAGYVTTTDLQTEISLVEKQITGVASTIPTKTSQLNNDSGLATEDYVNQQVRNSIISALNTEV